MKRITKKWQRDKKRPVVVLDYDDVLFDFLGTVIDKYNKKKKKHIRREQIKDWDLSTVGDIHVFMDIIRDGNLWYEIPEKNESMKIVQRLINDGRWNVLICTACGSLEEYEAKVHIIERKIPDFDVAKIVNIVDKHLIRGDVIIDDKIDNLDKCKPYMHCILMDMPHNRQNTEYQRIKNLKQLPQILEDLFCY